MANNSQFNNYTTLAGDYDIIAQKLTHLESEKKEYIAELKSINLTNQELTANIEGLKHQHQSSNNVSKILSQRFRSSFSLLERECNKNAQMQLTINQNAALIHQMQEENDFLHESNKKYENALEHIQRTTIHLQKEKEDITEQLAQKVEENDYLITELQILQSILSQPIRCDNVSATESASYLWDKEDTAQAIRVVLPSKQMSRTRFNKTYVDEYETDISDVVFIKKKSQISVSGDRSVDYQRYVEIEADSELQCMKKEIEILTEKCDGLRNENQTLNETCNDYKMKNNRLMQRQQESAMMAHRLVKKRKRIRELETIVNELSVEIDPSPKCYVLPNWLRITSMFSI